MIIKDLQYIESVDTSEIQGGSFFFRFRSAFASSNANALSFGRFTSASTNTTALADSTFGVSSASSNSVASASS